MHNPFRYFTSSPEVIRLAVMMYVRYPLSLSNAQLFLQPRADGAVPVGNESGLVGKYLMEHPHLFDAGEVVFDDDFDRQSRPADFGGVRHALVPDDQQMRRHGLLGCSVQCSNRTTEHPMAEYLAGVYGKPFHHYDCHVRSEMAPSAGNEVFLTGDRDAAGLYRPAARCVIGAGDFRNVETTLRGSLSSWRSRAAM